MTMFDALLRLLTGDNGDRGGDADDPAFALAALLIETARSDDRVETRERQIIERALARRFGLSPWQMAELIGAAEQGAVQATDLFRFTRVVVANFTEAERIGLIEMLWEVAYSDAVLSGDEDTLIRRVAGLIGVTDRDRGEAK
ncbi:MAG TPA: TerB family tellurite resistance protein, partial [Stellaceae bacterium]|nr:TerB family tellurite resistance protein [Stellaceae bacterium]